MANTTVSVSFANGFVGDASRNNEASNAAYLTAKGWSNFQFSQVTNNGQFGGSQGNDYSGTILITDAAGVQHTIDGVINWRAPSGAVSTIVFYATGSAHTLATAGGGSYVIDPYTEVNGDARSFIGLTFNNATLAINNGSVTGNAATNGLMSALNTYLADQPQLSVSDATVDEAAGTVSVTISLSKASADTVTVKYATEDGSAGAGTDYGAASGTVSFAPGQLTRTIQIPITDNAVVNGARDFTVVLSDSAFAAIIDNTGMLTITDNDVAPAVPVISSVLAEDAAHTGANPVDSTVAEGASLLYTVALNTTSPSPTEHAVTLGGSAGGADRGAITFSSGVAWKNADPATGIVIVPANVGSFTVTIATADDSAIESIETVVLTVGGVSATGTITDNDSQSVTSVLAEDAAHTGANPVDSTVAEGASLLYTVALNTTSPSPTEHSLTLGGSAAGADLGGIAFSGGVAWKNADPATGIVVVPANVGSFTVTIATVDDSAIESAENVVLTIGGVSATGTITDNDSQSVTSVLAEDAAHTGANPVDSSVGETGTLLYTVTLNVSSPSPTEYSLALSGSASGADLGAVSFSDGVDWKNADASTGIVVVPANVASFTVAIAAADDSVIEHAESVVLTVGGVSATGTITDNDSQSVTSVRAEDAAATGANPVDSTVVEGGSLLFTVALNTVSPAPTEYAFALGGSATGADLGSIAFSYGVAWKNGDPATGTIVVSANVGSFDVLIATTDDSAIENAESVVLTVGGVSATGTITDNDTAPPVVLPPVVQPPIVQPPIVQPPIVQPPVEPPVTEPPVVQPPVVQPPVVQPPVVQPPVVQPPVVQPPVVQPPVVQPPVVQPPVVQPPVVQPPSIKATLTQASDNGANASDGVTSLVRPEFSIAAGSYLSEGGSVRLVRPDGQVAGSSVITAADAQSGSITVGTAQLDDGVYQFVSKILDSSGKVVASSIVNVTIVTDIDGVAPSVEMAANGGDFNHDGVADWQQHTVAQMPLASLADFLAGKNAAASSFGAILAGDVHAGQPGGGVQLSTGAQLLDLSLSAAPAALPDNLTQASPMFNFSVTSESGAAPLADMDASREGLQTRVVIDLASGGVLSNDFMKWDQQNQRWYSFLDDGRLDTYDNGATLLDTNRDGRTDRIVITLTDGGWGDEDGVANGTIVDPGMLAYSMDPQRAPVYSVLLSTGDRYYSAHAADAARMAAGSGNVFEGVRFDGLDASLGGRHVGAYFQPCTRDWAFAADGESLPYACYGKVVTETGFSAAAVGVSESDYHLYKNARGLTQYATTAEAQAMQLQAAGYSDLGARFSTTAHNAFSFDAEGYLLANKTSTAVQHLVLSLAAQYGSTSDAGFIDAVEQDYLAQVQLVGTVHAGSATAADLNAAFGTSFA